MKVRKGLALFLALMMLTGLFAGCAKEQSAEPVSTDPAQQSETLQPAESSPAESQQGVSERPEHTPELAPVTLEAAKPAGSYEEIRTLLQGVSGYAYGGGGSGDAVSAEAPAATGAPTEAGAVYNGALAEPDAPASEEGRYGDGDYGTNVQVAGVDELDSVKTDGTLIYVMTTQGFLILKAAGADTAISCRRNVLAPDESEEDGKFTVYRNPLGIFVGKNRLALLYNYNSWGEVDGKWQDLNGTRLAIYDTGDPEDPKLLADLGQDGWYTGARMIGDTIYLISSDYVGWIEENAAPEDYVPCVYNGADATLLPADRIYLCPEPDSVSYTVVGAYDLQSAAALDNCAFTDACDTVYMNADALYLGRSISTETESEPYTENQYTVVDHSYQTTTEIKKLTLGETLELRATGTVPGELLNQFSLDAYDGNLRVATTILGQSYSVYTDEAYGFENYDWQDGSMNNRITVLDGDLKEIGALDDLVEDERIYSVRFLGELGYVVTFESIDPVFAIDFRDPTAPKLLSALELPGVSDYLHPFGEGRLFGFGRAVNEDGRSEGLQLSMFDISDPTNVTLEGKLVLPDTYSEASYDHHAIFVNTARGMIGFPMNDYGSGTVYCVYSYADGAFTENAAIDIDYYTDNMRGLLIDGMLYICCESVTYVIDLSSFRIVTSVSDAMG